jgi:hypothetical protein
LFTEWTIAIFEEYNDDQFKTGMKQLMADVREVLDEHSESEESSSSDSDGFDDESVQPTSGIPVTDIFESLIIDELCGEILNNATHTIWRSLKARRMVVSMVETARDAFVSLLARFEYHRQFLTESSGMDIDETRWPPSSNAERRVAKTVVPSAWDAARSTEFADHLRQLLTEEFLAQVNHSKHANSTLRNQMQALVLAITDLIVDQTATTGVEQLKVAVDQSIG